ncbi:MAG: LysM peptidoglycan-binding domain-containing protein [Planctomycetes bacterium]|nr:LysM peptidoglycan-binding domain-containing protein [Planctomycetota bacterium]MBU1517488.1 LysM peptidoglycan-binding domain-containing protein [Planctomycetota bacterium]MBU2458596.1 LysM peptidoglycan-binding domain-containing protein [Planctomycetota bacterium]MBU2596714.1 LysM peptidoglycan-binding domain-containing protein [Planctomycetota bacterium]
MRKDVKTGLLVGTGLCLAVAVWFCMHQQVIEQPRIKPLLPQDNIEADISSQTTPAETERKAHTSKIDSLRTHIVQPGQTLSDISKIYYDTTGNWKKIYEVNKESLPNGPDTIRVGMKLVIPE